MTKLGLEIGSKIIAKAKAGTPELVRKIAGVGFIKISNLALGFLTTIAFARFLQPADLGVYLFAITIAQFVAMPLLMGLPSLIIREVAIARAGGDVSQVWAISNWSRALVVRATLILTPLMLGGFWVARNVRPEMVTGISDGMILLTAALIPLIAEMKRQMGVLSGFEAQARGLMPDGLIRPLLLAFFGIVGLAIFHVGPFGLLAVYVSSTLVAVGFGQAFINQVQVKPPTKKSILDTRYMWGALLPLSLYAAADAVKVYSDLLMIGAFLDPAELAFYKIATQIAMVSLIVQISVNSILGPRVAKHYAKGEVNELRRVAILGSRISFVATGIYSLGLLCISSKGFEMILGPGYKPVFSLSVLISFGMSLTTVFGGSVLLLNMMRLQNATMLYAVGTAIANVGLNMLLIPLLGIEGAAISTIVTTLAMKALSWQRLQKEFGFRTDAFALIKS